MLSVGRGLTARDLFKELVDGAWDNDETVPDQKKLRLIKRIARKAFRKGELLP